MSSLVADAAPLRTDLLRHAKPISKKNRQRRDVALHPTASEELVTMRNPV